MVTKLSELMEIYAYARLKEQSGLYSSYWR